MKHQSPVKKNPAFVFLMCAALCAYTNFSFGNSDTTLLFTKLDEAQSDSAKVAAMLGLGSAFVDNNPMRAMVYFEDALTLSENKETEFFTRARAICYNRKGITATIQGDYSQSVAYYQQALELFNALSEAYPKNTEYTEGKAVIYGNIGTIYYHQEFFTKAIEYWEKAIIPIRELNLPYSEAQLLNNIGVVYREKNDFGKALEYFNKALDIFEAEQSEKDIAMSYTNIGDVYTDMGLHAKALELYRKSLALKQKSDDKHGIIQCYLSIAGLYFNMKEYSSSIEFADLAMTISKEIDDKKDLGSAYELLSKNYAAAGNFERAYSWYIQFKNINDSIFNKENQDRFMELQSQYESKIQEKEISLLRQTEQHQRKIKELLFVGIFFVLIMASLLLWSIIARRKKDKTIFTQRTKLLEQEKQLINVELARNEQKTEELNKEIEYKTRQLTTHALHIMQKNRMLYELVKSIDAITKDANQEIRPGLRKLKMQLKQSLKTEKDWAVFKLYFEQVNEDFFENLRKLTPELNTHDLRHCALIKLSLNIKETASVLNLSPNSIKSARYRLKKKLALEPEDDLFEFIRKV